MYDHDIECLEAHQPIGLQELARLADLETAELMELVEYGALVPLADTTPAVCFSLQCLKPLRAAAHLRRVYDLDVFVVAMLMEHLARIESLEGQLHAIQAKWANL